MEYADVPAVEQVTREAFYTLEVETRPANWPAPQPRSPERARQWISRLEHLLRHDPGGCWVAVDESGGGVVGAAVALVREGLWGLSTFAVLPGWQAQGTGKRLLDAALCYSPTGPGVICSSHDPKAVRRYRLAGFRILPAVLLAGRVRRDKLPRLSHLRDGSADDIELLNEVDRVSRGHAHGVDHEVMASQHRLVVIDRGSARGYCYIYAKGSPYVLSATDVPTAQDLLWASLAETSPDDDVSFGDMTAEHLWAFDVGFQAGLGVYNEGFMCFRDMPAWSTYIPSGHFL